jgi:hypothetical protein
MAKHMEAVCGCFDIPEQDSSPNITCACKHCGEELKSTITRLHAHVAGVKGEGSKICMGKGKTPLPKPLRLELKQLWDRNVAEREAKKKAQQAARERGWHPPHRVRVQRAIPSHTSQGRASALLPRTCPQPTNHNTADMGDDVVPLDGRLGPQFFS